MGLYPDCYTKLYKNADVRLSHDDMGSSSNDDDAEDNT